MRPRKPSKWLARSGRPDARSARLGLLALVTLVSALVVAGCGGSSHNATTATRGTSALASTGTAGVGATSPHKTVSDAAGEPGLAFARCMRANGVPNFPDPQPGPGLLFSANGLDLGAPAVKAAQAKCHTLLPPGPPGPGSQTHPSAQTLTKLRKIAQCMRQHGISDFPDPRTSVPSNPFGGGLGEITDFDGAILLFPATMNLEAPAYKQALAACGAPPLGLPH